MADRAKTIKLAAAGVIFVVAIVVAVVRFTGGNEAPTDDIVDQKAKELQAAIQAASSSPPSPDRAPASTPRAKGGDRGAKTPDGSR
ncbi:MAG: hypothetical protein JNM80_14375 [Phycisphaerae bacterium]|nr:hypothetical protein [Phycisphaerae bacterium]